MIEGELKSINRALAFQKLAGITAAPVPLEKYLTAANVELRTSDRLRDDEAGQLIPLGARSIIVVNARHSPERQRFTVLHEIAHLVLELPSRHGPSLTTDALLRYRSRPGEEILCDIFASECLLPRQLFIPDARSRPCTLRSVQELAERYEASLTATGSRFAACHDEPCAWILADEQRIRYVSISPALREADFYAQFGTALPRRSVLGRLAAGELPGATATDVVPSYVWTSRACRDIEEFTEEAILIPSLSQGVALLCAEERAAGAARTDEASEDDERLRALDGQLTFHKRTRRS